MSNIQKPKYSKILIASLFALLVSACGKQADGEANPYASSIIVGDLGWKEITSLSTSHPIRRAGKPVADIDLPAMGSRCTGFLISEDVLMTNQHCIPSSSYARGVTAVFNHQKGVSKSSQRKYDCSTFIGNDRTLDYALLKCQGSPGRTYGVVELDDLEMPRGESIFIVQQNCDYYTDRDCDWTKKYSLGAITKVEDEYTHNADTLGGSSGSPVFQSDTGKVIAIHHAGYGNNGQGRGVENYAVPMSKIVPHILTNYPQVDLGEVSGGSDDDDDQGSGQTGDEPNDSKSQATALSGTSLSSRSAAIATTTDIDYYKLSVPTGSDVTVSINFSHSEGDLDMKVESSTGATLGKSAGTGNTETVSLSSASGTIYFKIFGYKGAKAQYTLSFSVSKKATTNDTMEGATKISLPYLTSSKSIGTSKDLDYYTFTLTKAKSVTASISFTHSSGDLELYLLDSAGKVIGKSTSTKSVESISKTLSSGKYYVLVFGYKGAKGNYSMSLK